MVFPLPRCACCAELKQFPARKPTGDARGDSVHGLVQVRNAYLCDACCRLAVTAFVQICRTQSSIPPKGRGA